MDTRIRIGVERPYEKILKIHRKTTYDKILFFEKFEDCYFLLLKKLTDSHVFSRQICDIFQLFYAVPMNDGF